MVSKYTIKELNTTDGKRYILVKGGKVSLSERTYFKKKSNAQRRADKLNS